MTGFNASRAVELGYELRAARKRAHLRQGDVAQALGRNISHVSRWERGKLLPSEADTASMLTLYKVMGEERDRLLAMAREAADPNWVVPGMGRTLAALVATESAARRIVNVETQLIPGLAQTDAYARVAIANTGIAEDQIGQLADLRLMRQAILEADGAPEYVAVVPEYALLYPPCDITLMIEQLQKLLLLSELPNVSIHVLRMATSDTPALYGSFVLMEPRQGDPVIRQENYRAATTISGRRDVRDYQAAVDKILRKAMDRAGSVAFIEQLLERLERGNA